MFLKLGEHASMFFDPTSMVKILPGQVVAVNAKQQQSKKLKKAKNAGHVIVATADEYEDYLAGVKEKAAPASEEDTEEVDIYSMKKSALVKHASEVLADDYSKEDLNEMTKADIIELLEA